MLESDPVPDFFISCFISGNVLTTPLIHKRSYGRLVKKIKLKKYKIAKSHAGYKQWKQYIGPLHS